jgi:PA domain
LLLTLDLAAFGAEITDPILGYVIPLASFAEPCRGHAPHNSSLLPENAGCPNLCIKDGMNQPGETWIALVQRGQCEFVKKVREAQRFGARAVVVGGGDPLLTGFPDTLVNMYSPGESVAKLSSDWSLTKEYRGFIGH